MPETTVNENNALPGWKNQIGGSWKIFLMKAIAIAEPVEEGAYLQLQSGVLALDAGHVAAALLRGNIVHPLAGY